MLKTCPPPSRVKTHRFEYSATSFLSPADYYNRLSDNIVTPKPTTSYKYIHRASNNPTFLLTPHTKCCLSPPFKRRRPPSADPSPPPRPYGSITPPPSPTTSSTAITSFSSSSSSLSAPSTTFSSNSSSRNLLAPTRFSPK